MNLGSRPGHCLIALVATALLLSGIIPSQLRAQDGGTIGVENDGPSFVSTSINETEELIIVTVEVRDLNGWADIFTVNVTIIDGEGNPLSQVSYMQYQRLNTTAVAPMPYWNETVGTYLDRTQAFSEPLSIAPWNPENTATPIGLRIIFPFSKFSGDNIRILAMDLGSLTCEDFGPFSAEYTPAPAWDNVAIPISLSTATAAGAALFMAYRRFKNNKLARAVEASHSASGEE